MAGESGSCSGRIGLNGVTFIQIVLVVKLFEQPPQCLYITVVISYIRIVQIHPVTYLKGEVAPVLLVFHNLGTAVHVVILDRDFLTYILLGYTEFFFHRKFDGQSVSIPAGLTFNHKPAHGLVAAKNILNSTCHDMVDSRHSVSRRRAFVEYKRRAAFTLFYASVKNVFLLPVIQHFLIDFRKVKLCSFGKFFHPHSLYSLHFYRKN
ncbi:MAG: hypothetical protein BWY95_01771 [Bacteroidetes bacterium ADurb.BinA104]|nr:MAG: hypothetical protein BWY95_01771 [Bacteroidetes bacterium ADurb.BinA104]